MRFRSNTDLYYHRPEFYTIVEINNDKAIVLVEEYDWFYDDTTDVIETYTIFHTNSDDEYINPPEEHGKIYARDFWEIDMGRVEAYQKYYKA